jgi:hypothetical protein
VQHASRGDEPIEELPYVRVFNIAQILEGVAPAAEREMIKRLAEAEQKIAATTPFADQRFASVPAQGVPHGRASFKIGVRT